MSATNWSGMDDEILINFVRNHEIIYNIKSKPHRDTQLKQSLWREIAEVLNKTDSDCCKRWCYVRDYYIRRRGKPPGGEAAKKRAELLSFLDVVSPPLLLKNNSTNIVDETSGDSSVKLKVTVDVSEATESFSQKTEDLECYNDDSIELDNKDQYTHVADITTTKDAIPVLKKRKHSLYAQERLNLLKQIVNQNAIQNRLDENDLFFSSMAKIVKKLPRCEQARLRMQVGSLIGNAELRYNLTDSPLSSTFSTRLGKN